ARVLRQVRGEVLERQRGKVETHVRRAVAPRGSDAERRFAAAHARAFELCAVRGQRTRARRIERPRRQRGMRNATVVDGEAPDETRLPRLLESAAQRE